MTQFQFTQNHRKMEPNFSVFIFCAVNQNYIQRLLDGARLRMLQERHLRDLLQSRVKKEKGLCLSQKEELRAGARRADLLC